MKEQKDQAEKRENDARSAPDQAAFGSAVAEAAHQRNAERKAQHDAEKEARKPSDEAEIANRRTQTQKESDVPNPDDDSISRRDAIESFRATTGEVPKSLQDAEDKAQAQKAE